jgi:hypothetical protein
MEVTLLLTDSAQVDPTGKAHALGIGWDQTTSPTAPASVLVLIDVPWNDTNRQHDLVVQLRDADGHPVIVPSPVGDQQVQMVGGFEIGRPPGMAAGTAQTVKLAFTLGPLPLTPGRYEWHAEVGGHSSASWVAAFTVLASPPAQQP